VEPTQQVSAVSVVPRGRDDSQVKTARVVQRNVTRTQRPPGCRESSAR
jgi:hypothetical protein